MILLLAGALGLLQPPGARATADGPDHYQVRGIAAGNTLAILAEPRAGAAAIGRAPADAVCLRNLGCLGGLTFEEFSILGDKEKRRRSAANPRWCRIEYQGLVGWVDARHLVEAPCPQTDTGAWRDVGTVAFAKGSALVKGRLSGRQFTDYRVRVRAGQTLTVVLKASNRQAYFNLTPGGSDSAMFVGSVSGERFSATVPATADYIVRVYLMRAAARRNEATSYALHFDLAGQALEPLPASRDAQIPGTSFHASGRIPCVPFLEAAATSCEAFVIRYQTPRAATVEVRSASGRVRRILFMAGVPVASDAPDTMSAGRQGDAVLVRFGSDERYEIRDAFVEGG